MVLTAHFLDGDWIVHKKILNFCKIEDHRGETLSNKLEKCLQDWGIEKVLTITVDNASSNNIAIGQLVRILQHGNELILDGAYVHVRCFAHILNLIVVEGLKEHKGSIDRVRKAVKYVKSSPQRLQPFKNCIDILKITFKGNVTFDVPTRWNSMFLMLENAEKYSKAFELLEDSDRAYMLDMEEHGAPTSDDWTEICELCKFLKVFYDTTVKVSASLHITAHRYVIEVCEVKKNIQSFVDSENAVLKNITIGMITKFDKYWGTFDKFNTLFFIALLLDPRCKDTLLKYCLSILFGSDKVSDLYKQIESVFEKLYMEYKGNDGPECSIIEHPLPGRPTDFISDFFGRVLDTNSSGDMSECQEYLRDKLVQHHIELELLKWWKVNEPTYPVLSKIAKDLLIIPVSTIASESAFSCGGRIVDSSRTSLLPTTVEAIICTQSWLRSNTTPISDVEIVDDYDTIDEELAASNRTNDEPSDSEIAEAPECIEVQDVTNVD